MFSLRRYGRGREGVRIPSLKPRWTLQVAPCNKISKRSIPFCQERVLLEVSPANVGKPLQHGMIQWIMHWGISLTIVKMHDATTLVVSPLAASADTTRCQGDHHQPPVRCDPATMAVSTFHGVASWKMGNNLEHLKDLKVGTETWLHNCA